ncbi:carboxymuconolactone decarboxylase family protein [Halococcus thailandensis]|uniref:Carboxymuconolactone decarboxylase n=1 Tax=Halococcus thailandensis JCM 13552 TaxID=1227457 RepID=M0NG56_9EURY|nr:carboxymuconolactone decarboxylase family protein [Halococcus thailandensis]EMA56069.1 carboxymuconolactone decarboxylase [Halococcus thailandensis JCM 13552]
MADEIDDPEQLPSTAGDLAERHPEVWGAYAELGRNCSEAGPLDDETKRLVKLALAVGTQSEGAVHSHTRRALDEGIPPEAVHHIAVLAIPTLGFPEAMAAMSWIGDLLEEED